FNPVSAADHAGKLRIYQDPAFRDTFKATFGSAMAGPFMNPGDRMWVSYCPLDPALEERALCDVARERGVDVVDCMLDLAVASDLQTRFRMAVVNYDEDAVGELLNDPHTVLGLSDAGAHASQLCDACFSTHLLGHWVREMGVLSLEQAVWRLTGHPSQVFRLRGRGLVREGFAADLVAFDPDTVGVEPMERMFDLPGGADRLIVQSRSEERRVG